MEQCTVKLHFSPSPFTNIAAFSTNFSSQLLHELENDAPNVFAQTRLGEAEVERFRGSDWHVGVHVLEAEEERGADGDAGKLECGWRGLAALACIPHSVLYCAC